MVDVTPPIAYRWIRTGEDAFARMTEAIEQATRSVRFEIYILTDCGAARDLLGALVRAAQRGLEVRVLIDAFGSIALPDSFWDPLRAVGGQMRWFNPLSLARFNIRDHRKLLVCDHARAVIGGFNVAAEWMGDGVHQGWRDLGLELSGPLAVQLAWSFDEMFALAEFRHRRPTRLRRAPLRRALPTVQGDLLLTGPGRGRKPIRAALQRDFARATRIGVIAAYFLPPPRLRRALQRAARRGARVQIVLPALSDVPLLQAATRSLYTRFLRSGIELFEYEPQILHSKFVSVDDAVYVGSANLDRRSLGINYDFLVRLTDPALVAEGEHIMAEHLEHSRAIRAHAWKRSRSLWAKLLERFALFLFTRVDPLVTRYQLRNFR